MINLHIIQNTIHKNLVEFLGYTSLDKKSQVFFPVIKEERNDFKKLIPLFAKTNIKIPNTNTISEEKYAELISETYKLFYKKIKPTKVKKTVKAREFSSWNTNDPFIKPVLEIKEFYEKELKEHALGIFLNGSLATLDYKKGFSDLDCLIILKKETIESKEKLIELRKKIKKILPKFYEIDPLQHHGFQIITEQEMNYYPEHYFPTELFKHGVSLTDKNKELTFSIRNDEEEREFALKRLKEYFLNPKLNNDYRLKLYVSKLLLLPTIYLQSKGKHTYKKYSFEKAKNDLKNYWPAIEKAIQLRKSWQQPKATTKFTLRVLSKTRNPNHMKILGYTKRRTISKFPILKTPNNQVLNPGQIKQNRKQTQKNG